MNKLHPGTTLAVILNVAAITCFIAGSSLSGGVLSVIAYFSAIKEISRYTSWYQFITVFTSAFITGLILDQQVHFVPLITAAMALATAASIARIMYFCKFAYTGHTWFEPLMLSLSLVAYLVGNLSGYYNWQAWVLPVPGMVFACILTYGILKDKKQLLIYTRHGYQVRTGQPASDFSLPDQNGIITTLSEFKHKRHVLLIFVRGDWCPGCHMMLRTYEKNNEKFKAKNIIVMAIGPDPVGVNRAMVEKLGLEFRVLADEKQRTAMVYGVQMEEYDNAFAETYEEGIPLPASFLIDKTGVVRYVSRPDKVGEFLNPSLIFPIIDQLS